MIHVTPRSNSPASPSVSGSPLTLGLRGSVRALPDPRGIFACPVLTVLETVTVFVRNSKMLLHSTMIP